MLDLKTKLKANTTQFKIDGKAEEIKQKIKENDVLVTVTPTGSGKTMAVPAYAQETMGGKVYVLEPRVIAAKKAAIFAKESVWGGSEFGAAYITGRGGSSSNQNDASVVYITEGSFTARDIRNRLKPNDVIVMDEVHEQNTSTEPIHVIAMGKAKEGIKVVVMSATTDPQKYVDYYQSHGLSVGLVQMEPQERQYPIHHEVIEAPLAKIADIASKGGRCLVGVAGKREIGLVITSLRSHGQDLELIPYHGQLDEDEESYARKLMSSGKQGVVFIGTNVLQSSVTIKDLDAGYYSGWGKRIESENGEQVLKDYLLSEAEMQQWYGRGGRTKPYTVFHNKADMETERILYPTANIFLEPTESTIIEFLGSGIDIRNGGLLNQPDADEVKRAWERLERLGFISGGQLTDLGKFSKGQRFSLPSCAFIYNMEKCGLPVLGRKMARVMEDDPFRKASIGNALSKFPLWKHSTFALYAQVVDMVREQFGYKVDTYNGGDFKDAMDSIGIHRKSMKKLFKDYGSFEDNFSDDKLSPWIQRIVVDESFRKAFPDRIFDPYDSREHESNPFRQCRESKDSLYRNMQWSTGRKVGTLFSYNGRHYLKVNLLLSDEERNRIHSEEIPTDTLEKRKMPFLKAYEAISGKHPSYWGMVDIPAGKQRIKAVSEDGRVELEDSEGKRTHIPKGYWPEGSDWDEVADKLLAHFEGLG